MNHVDYKKWRLVTTLTVCWGELWHCPSYVFLLLVSFAHLLVEIFQQLVKMHICQPVQFSDYIFNLVNFQATKMKFTDCSTVRAHWKFYQNQNFVSRLGFFSITPPPPPHTHTPSGVAPHQMDICKLNWKKPAKLRGSKIRGFPEDWSHNPLVSHRSVNIIVWILIWGKLTWEKV